MKLRELTTQLTTLQQDEDLTPELIQDTLEALEGEFQLKAESVAHVILNIDSDVQAISAEIDRLNARKKVMENKAASIKEYIKSNMIAADIKKISCPLFSITLAAGRDVVDVYDQDSIDEEYLTVKTTIAPDKRKILSALKDNPESIEGAKLSKSAPSLRIK